MFWKRISSYAKLPEMRLFWLLLPLVIILSVINVVSLSGFWIPITLGSFLLLVLIVAINSLRLARSNLEIKIERNELKSIIFNLRDGIIAYDPNFRMLIFNHAAEIIFGVGEKEVIGQYFSPEKAKESQFHLLTQVIFPSLAPVAIRRSEPGAFPQVVDISFEERQLELRVVTDRITDPGGQLLGFVKLVHDRTREVALIRSKNEFITVAAHQLRTPLSAVNWSLEVLKGESLTDPQKAIVDSGVGAAAKLLKTVNDLLDVSKIEEGRFGYEFKNINIVEFLEEVIRETGERVKQAAVKLYFERPKEESINVLIDENKMRMAVLNVLDNAVKYNVENGEVVVGLRRLENKPFVEISVKDTGVGIPANQMSKLFSKFFRGENVMQLVTEGTGLGLYIVKNILKRHGGDIRAESEVNRGSTFYITIPTDPSLIPPKELAYEEE